MYYTQQEIAEIKEYAQKHICPHYANNIDLNKNQKVYVRSDDVYVYDIEGKHIWILLDLYLQQFVVIIIKRS